MADNPQTSALITLSTHYFDVVRQANRIAATLFLMEKREGRGPNVSWSPENSGINVGAYAETDDITDFGSDSQDAATLQWGLNFSSFRMTDLAGSAARTADSPQANFALLGRNMVNANMALSKYINGQFFTGTGYAGSTKVIAGLDNVLLNTNTTIAGIDRSSKTYFQSNNFGSTSKTALSLATISADLAAIKNTSGIRPDRAAVNPALLSVIASLAKQDRRYIQDVRSNGDIAFGESLGIPAVMVDGCLFYEDSDGYYSSGGNVASIYYLNSEYVHAEYLPVGAGPDELGFVDLEMAATDGVAVGDCGYYMVPLSRTGPSKKVAIFSQMQLVVERPNACGLRRGCSTLLSDYSF